MDKTKRKDNSVIPRYYLKDGDRAFANCYIKWDANEQRFIYDGYEEAWFDGQDVLWDEGDETPYIDK